MKQFKENFALSLIAEEEYEYSTGLCMLRIRLGLSATTKALSTLVHNYDAETEAFVLSTDGILNDKGFEVDEMVFIMQHCRGSKETEKELNERITGSLNYCMEGSTVEGGSDSLEARLGKTPSMDASNQITKVENDLWQVSGDRAVEALVDRVLNGEPNVEKEPDYVGFYILREGRNISDLATHSLNKRWKRLEKPAKDKAVQGIQYLEAIIEHYC
jgi:hypothetical protein